jgi:hypothetical protein
MTRVKFALILIILQARLQPREISMLGFNEGSKTYFEVGFEED